MDGTLTQAPKDGQTFGYMVAARRWLLWQSVPQPGKNENGGAKVCHGSGGIGLLRAV